MLRYCRQCGTFRDTNDAHCFFDQSELITDLPKAAPFGSRCPRCNEHFLDGKLVVCKKDKTLLLPLRGPGFSAPPPRYHVGPIIAANQIAAVVRAMDLENQLEVALKIMKSTSEEDPQRQRKIDRFRRQIDTQSSLQHPNIVELIGSGENADGMPFIVFEYLKSISLEQARTELRRLPLGYCVSIFLQVCEALQYAHDRGVVHGDLALNDVLIDLSRLEMHVKVNDFAKGSPLIHGANKSMQSTEVHDAFGHPQFMSPEAFYGKELTPQSNVYSLGVMMLLVLSTTDPFQAGHWGGVLLKKISDEPLQLEFPQRAEAEYPRLQKIIERCLQKEPENRFQTMRELKQELMPLLDKAVQPKTCELISMTG